jgi:hypothetical protein
LEKKNEKEKKGKKKQNLCGSHQGTMVLKNID